MHLQRVGDDENPAERSLSNGPQRARRTVADRHVILENRCLDRLPSISRRRAGVILPGYVSILSKSTDDFVKQGGTAGNVYYSSLAGFSAEGVFLLPGRFGTGNKKYFILIVQSIVFFIAIHKE